jgi:carbamoyl-phosphate synthase small subunit
VLSNGPGDTAVLGRTIHLVGELLGDYPIMGICLGHQLLALALGGHTYKMKFGHRGSNHPVQELTSGQVVITTQNHGYAVDSALPHHAVVTHVSLNDGTVEGLRHRDLPIFSVQFHPEGRPGPSDAEFLYDRFVATLAPRAPEFPRDRVSASTGIL